MKLLVVTMMGGDGKGVVVYRGFGYGGSDNGGCFGSNGGGIVVSKVV